MKQKLNKMAELVDLLERKNALEGKPTLKDLHSRSNKESVSVGREVGETRVVSTSSSKLTFESENFQSD